MELVGAGAARRAAALRGLGPVPLFAVLAVTYGLLAVSAFEVFGALTIGVTFFPPAGLTFASLLLLPGRRWPVVVAAIVVAEVAVDMGQGGGFWWSLGWAGANSAEPLVGAAIARQMAATVALDARFLRAVLVGGLLVGPAVGASVGATVLAIHDDFSWVSAWSDVWVGDALGVLVVAPLVLVAVTPSTGRMAPARRAEAVAIAAAVGTLVVALLTTENLSVGYVAIPVLAWSALRLGPRGLALTAAAVAAAATGATARGSGPWADLAVGAQGQLGRQQFFLLVAVGGAWMLAFEVRRRVQAVERASTARVELDRALERAALLEDTQRERDHVAALQALTAALTGATTPAEVADVVRAHGPALVEGRRLSLELAGTTDAAASMRTAPPGAVRLRAGSDQLGVLVVAAIDAVAGEGADLTPAPGGREPDPAARLQTVVELVTQALQRVRLQGEQEAQRRQLEAMNQALTSLARAASVAEVAAAARGHGPPAVGADAVLLGLRAGDGDEPGTTDLAVELVGWPPQPSEDGDAVGAGRVVVACARSGLPQDRRVDGAWWTAVPLSAGGRPQGAIGFSSPVPWTTAARLRGVTFASLIADALARIRQSAHDHEVALTLQRALMPQRTVRRGAAAVAGVYRPASDRLEVGGDWYDVVPRDDGLTLIVGDVVGHGLMSAAVMGRLSSAARALSLGAPDPAALVDALDGFAERTPGAETSTVVCARFEPARCTLSYCRAGHPAPLVRYPDGTVVSLEGGHGPPLTCGTGPRRSTECTLPAGALVLLYTDGLVEWRDSSIDERTERLAAVLSSMALTDPHQAVEAVVDAMTTGMRHTDDIAALCLVVGAQD